MLVTTQVHSVQKFDVPAHSESSLKSSPKSPDISELVALVSCPINSVIR
jgi:hypothetical protein